MSATYEYMEEEKIDPNMICSICNSPFTDPRCAPCEAVFCHGCITQWLKTSNSCPHCRKPLSGSGLKRAIPMIRDMLDRLPVQCVTCRKMNIRRSDFDAHVKNECPERVISSTSLDTRGAKTRQEEPTTQNSRNRSTQANSTNNSRPIADAPNIPTGRTATANLCPISRCSDSLASAICLHCSQHLCDVHMIQHRHQCQGHADHDSSSKTLWTFILSFIFFGIIFYLCDRDSPTTLIIETTKVVEKDAVAMPVSCRGTAQCPGRQASFEHSNLLTCEHQNHLNSFYNDTDSRVSRWKLIYRGSTDGFNAATFHAHCDNKGETFTILSSTNGHIFGGYTDANWTTSPEGFATYGRTTKAFIFSLMSSRSTPVSKFSLDPRYRNYATVNDFLSGPIFGGMTRPDIGIYESSGEFRCQINFPSVYKGGVGVPCFPTSDNCVINETEIFIPVFEKAAAASSSSFLGSILKMIMGLATSGIDAFIFMIIALSYNDRDSFWMRLFFSCLGLFSVWMNYFYGYMVLAELLLILILFSEWDQPNGSNAVHDIRQEKRLVLASFVILHAYMILFG